MTRRLSDADSSDLLHCLWTKAVGTTDYNKSEWLQLEAHLLSLQGNADRDAILAELRAEVQRNADIKELVKNGNHYQDIATILRLRAELAACRAELEQRATI